MILAAGGDYILMIECPSTGKSILAPSCRPSSCARTDAGRPPGRLSNPQTPSVASALSGSVALLPAGFQSPQRRFRLGRQTARGVAGGKVG